MPAERRYEESSTLGEKEEGCETGMRAMFKMFMEEQIRAEAERREERVEAERRAETRRREERVEAERAETRRRLLRRIE